METADYPTDVFLAFNEVAAGLDGTTSANFTDENRAKSTQTTDHLELDNNLLPENELKKYLIANGYVNGIKTELYGLLAAKNFPLSFLN